MFGGSATAHDYFRIASKAAMYRQPLSASRIQEFDCRYPHTATASAGSFPTRLSQRHFKRIGRVGSLRHTKKKLLGRSYEIPKKTDKIPSRNPQGFLHAEIFGQRAAQQIEIVRQPVEVHQYLRCDAILRIGPKRRPFCSTANRAADMTQRNDTMSARNSELGNRLHGSLHTVDRLFEKLHSLGVDSFHLVRSAFAHSQRRSNSHQLGGNACELPNTGLQPHISPQMVRKQGNESGQLVHRAVGLHPFVGLEHPFPPDQRSGSLVACFRIYLHNLKCCFGK